MRRMLCLFLSIGISLMGTGCSNATPLKEKLIVEGIGIDFDQEEFVVTLQVYAPSSNESEGGEGQLFTQRGRTVQEALAQIDKNLGKTSFFADTKVIVLSYQALQQGLWKVIDVFVRSSELGSNVCVVATENNPVDVFSIEKEGNNMAAKILANGLRYGRSDSAPVSGELMRVVQGLMDESVTVSMPMVKVEEKEGKKYPVFERVLCFKEDKPVYQMNEEMKWVYHWMNQYDDKRSFLVEDQGNWVSLLLHQSKVSTTVTVEHQKPLFLVELTIKAEVGEVSSPHLLTEEGIKGLQVITQEKMEGMINKTLETVINQQNCDVFRLGKTLKKQQSAYYKSLSSWYDTMKNSTYNVQVELEITRVGGQAVS